MKILAVNYEYPPIGGGGGFVTRDILEELAAQGHTVTIITSHYKGLKRKETRSGVEIIRVPVFFRTKIEVANLPSLMAYLPSGLVRALLDSHLHRYDVINTHFAVPCGPLGITLSKLLRIPNVLTIHGGDIYDPSKKLSPHRVPALSRTVHWVLQHSDRVVAQSHDTRANASRYHQSNRPIDIIPLGIRRPQYSHKTRKAFGLNDRDIVFCTIGRLVERKNLLDSLKLIQRLKVFTRAKLMIIGDGPERDSIGKHIRDLGLIEDVFMLGNAPDDVKFQVLDLSDIYLSTALHEGFGLVFLEAMACGLPILCHNRGGQTDFLKNHETGFLCDPGDILGLEQSARLLIDNQMLREQIRTHNYKHVEQFFIDSCAANYERLFEKVIRSANPKTDCPSALARA